MKLTVADIEECARNSSALDFITSITDIYLQHIGGRLTQKNMNMLNTNQHTLLAYRWMTEEVMEGGWIQLIQNGFAGYILEGPFPLVLKREWGMKELSKLIFDVRHEYHLHREELESDKTDEEFMALYEQLETLNDLGDEFLDEYQESTTPAVRDFVVNNALRFTID